MLPSRSFLLAILTTLGLYAVGGTTLHAQTASQLYTAGVAAYDHGDTAAAKQRLQTALELDRNFRPATLMLARIAAEQKEAAAGRGTPTLQKARMSVEFNETTLSSALDFIRAKVAADSGNKLVINFVVNLPPELANKKISLKLNDAPVLQIFRYIGQLAGVNFDRQQYAIVVTPVGAAPAATPEN